MNRDSTTGMGDEMERHVTATAPSGATATAGFTTSAPAPDNCCGADHAPGTPRTASRSYRDAASAGSMSQRAATVTMPASLMAASAPTHDMPAGVTVCAAPHPASADQRAACMR